MVARTFNWVDGLTIGFLGLVVLGILAVQSGFHQTSSQLIEGETDIEFTVIMQNTRTLNTELFKTGDSTHITIRNQPRGNVDILGAKVKPRQVIVPTSEGYTLVADPAIPHAYNFEIRLKDHATVTKEGYVSEGLKIKTGLPIELEGFNYRLRGVIADVKPYTKQADTLLSKPIDEESKTAITEKATTESAVTTTNNELKASL